MNYLCHAFLSGNNENILIGNLLADSIDITDMPQIPQEFKNGLALHNIIDQEMDSSQEFVLSKAVFNEVYGRYSHVIVDILFDNLLSLNDLVYRHAQADP